MFISSLINLKIKEVVLLRNNTKRRALGLSIVEGVKEVTRALEARVALKEVYICKDFLEESDNSGILKKILSLKIPVIETTRAVFEKISYGDRNEGILAIFQVFYSNIETVNVKKNAFFVVVEGIEKPGNLGAILRTCDGAGVDGVIVCVQKTDIFNPNIIRSSLGAVFTVPVFVCSNEEVVSFCNSHGIKIVSSLPRARKNYCKCDMTGSVAIVMGREHEGLSDFWVKKSDEKVSLPMKGAVDSLNVSTSAAILIYEVLRQRS